MIKRILLISLVLMIATIASFFVWQYVKYSRDTHPHKTFLLPRLELSIFEIISLNAEKIEMNAKILVKNQLPLSFTADSLEYSIYISDVEVIQDRYEKSFTLESNDSSWILLPLTIYNKDLKKILESNEKKNIDTVEYRVQASFYTKIIFRKKFNIDIAREFPLIYFPEISMENIKIDSLNFSRVVLQLFVSVKNQNVFPITGRNINYKFAIEDHEWIEGIIPGLTDIKAQSVTDLEIPVTLSLKETAKTLFNLLRKGTNVTYKLNMTFSIDSDNQMIKDSKVILESSGKIKSLIKAGIL